MPEQEKNKLNDLIKEFARQAGFKVNWQHEDVQAIKMAQYKEFAELIVRECIGQAHGVANLRGANDDMIYGADTAAVRISKHFGVEE
jgi:uncharacterized protein (UPF0128 family)